MITTIKKLGIIKMGYLILPIIAGTAIILQTAFSGKISKEIGTIETVILVHFFGLIIALTIYFLSGKATVTLINDINLFAIMAGAMGVIIVFFISKSFTVNGALLTITISIIVQLIGSKIIDHFGLFGAERVPINIMQILSLILIISGVLLYQKK